MKGFTLVEILIVSGLVVFFMVLTVPVGIRFYKSQQLDTTADGIVQALRRAHHQATSQTEHSFGVFLGSEQYILFRGDSYASNDDEEIFNVESNIVFGGISEVVFSKLEGIPSIAGNITVRNEIGLRTVNINPAGRINYEAPVFIDCWGIGGFCDPECIYSDYGSSRSYYINPGCVENCLPAGIFYVNPLESCSDDGSGNCYKLMNFDSLAASSSQATSCEELCIGTCIPCEKLKPPQCAIQEECDWQGGRCVGTCIPCEKIIDSIFCATQLGCNWKETKWFWNLSDPLDGYRSYNTCVWLES